MTFAAWIFGAVGVLFGLATVVMQPVAAAQNNAAALATIGPLQTQVAAQGTERAYLLTRLYASPTARTP